MNLFKHLDKDNLHHAYLIAGEREATSLEVLGFIKQSFNVEVHGNANVVRIALDSFKVEDARTLKAYAGEKGFSAGKKFFIISANNFLLDAQNTLLKVFEEPIKDTHFFLIVPDTNALLPTFISRFYLLSPKTVFGEEAESAEKFLAMPLRSRLEFVKELTANPEDEEEDVVDLNPARAKALKFLNALESALHSKVSRMPLDIGCFHQIFKVREFLRMPGSSPKTLMESVALVVPNF